MTNPLSTRTPYRIWANPLTPALGGLLFCLLTGIGDPDRLMAQPTQSGVSGSRGEIQDAQIIFEKDRKIQLPIMEREFEVAELPRESGETTSKSARFAEPPPTPGLLDLKPRIVQVREGEGQAGRLGYVRGGLGNYGATYFEGGYEKRLNARTAVSAGIDHLAFVNGPERFSGDGLSSIRLGSRYFLDQGIVEGQLIGRQRTVHYYGNQSDQVGSRSQIREAFTTIGFELGLARQFGRDGLMVDMRPSVGRTSNRRSSNETFFYIPGTLSVPVNRNLRAGIDHQILVARVSDTASRGRYGLVLTPHIEGVYDPRFHYKLGFGVISRADSQGIASTSVFPRVDLRYTLTNAITLNAGVTGRLQPNLLQTLVDENPFAHRHINPQATAEKLVIYARPVLTFGGLRVTPSAEFGILANPYGFIHTAQDSNYLETYYEKANLGFARFEVAGEYRIDEQLSIGARIRAQFINLDGRAAPYGVPVYQDHYYIRYRWRDKLSLKGEWLNVGQIRYLNQGSGRTGTLPSFHDLGLGVEYHFSPAFSAGISLQNLLNQKTERVYLYRTRGLTAIVFLGYQF